MRDRRLADLNFKELIDYGGQPVVQNTYDPPLKCSGYCVACEDSGRVFDYKGDYFDQMSHGCDTWDFEQLLGPLPKAPGGYCDSPILFLLENPGGYYGNGEVVPYKGYKKQPPVNHYYWTPNPKEIGGWPKDTDSLPHLYGPYFAYLMAKYGLKNVYITNLIKCNVIGDDKKYNKEEAVETCINKWLKKELEIFSPELVFCFGEHTFDYFKQYLPEYYDITSRLYHPAARKPREEIVSYNDHKISVALRSL